MSELRRDPILRRWVIIAPERRSDVVPRRTDRPRRHGRRPLPVLPRPGAPEPRGDRGDAHARRLGRPRDARQAPAAAHRGRARPARRRHVRRDERDRRARAGRRHPGPRTAPGPTSPRSRWSASCRRLPRPHRATSRRDRRFRHAVVLKNHGAVWSHYPHAHSHVIATPFTPKRLEEELGRAHASTTACASAASSATSSPRSSVPARGSSRRNATLRRASRRSRPSIPTRRGSCRFATRPTSPRVPDDAVLAPLAACSSTRSRAFAPPCDDPPYSVVLHAGPLDGSDQAEFHWHWEIVPHLGHELGMEWATGNLLQPRGARGSRPPPAGGDPPTGAGVNASPPLALVERHELDDLVVRRAGRRLHLDLVADGLVEQRAADRRRKRYLPACAASTSSGKTIS